MRFPSRDQCIPWEPPIKTGRGTPPSGAGITHVVCAVCGSSVVNPVDWDENGALHWWVRLRCGECAWSREVIITDDEANQLDRDLELGLRDIAGVVERLDRERMVREADSFITALRHDLIGPSDFAHRLPR